MNALSCRVRSHGGLYETDRGIRPRTAAGPSGVTMLAPCASQVKANHPHLTEHQAATRWACLTLLAPLFYTASLANAPADQRGGGCLPPPPGVVPLQPR